MSNVALKQIKFGGVSLMIPEIWTTVTESYTEPDGRECAMIDISAEEGDPRSIIISYGTMPEGSDAFMEASDTYDELIADSGADAEEDPICEYDFLGSIGFGFDVPTEDNLACNFICVEVAGEAEGKSKLFTILTTAKEYEDIDDLLDLVEQNISLE